MNKRYQLFEHHHLHDGTIHWISLKVLLILLGLLCTMLKTASSEAHGHTDTTHGDTKESAVVTTAHPEDESHPSETTHATDPSHDKPKTESSPKPETLGALASQPVSAADPAWPEHLKLDPMFTAFPDLFTSPEIETGSVETYRKNKEIQYEAMFDLGVQFREQGNFSEASKHFVQLLKKRPPISYRKQAMLQLALIAEKEESLVRAYQIYSQYNNLFPNDTNQPLVYLRMGDILRRIGAMDQALDKYHSVINITTRISGLDEEYLPVVQRMVIKAKVEIAETHFMEGDYETAARLYERLLVERHSESDLVDIKRPLVHYKVIYSHYLNDDFGNVEESAESFLEKFDKHPKSIEVRYLLAKSYMKKGRRGEALDQFKHILELESELESEDSKDWVRVQVRIGVEIAELMIEEGDRTNAVQIHERLLELDLQDKELLDVLYKLGMLHEELKQNQKALAFYQRILDRISSLENGNLATLSRFHTTMKEMAGWRIEVLQWLQTKESELQSAEKSA